MASLAFGASQLTQKKHVSMRATNSNLASPTFLRACFPGVRISLVRQYISQAYEAFGQSQRIALACFKVWMDTSTAQTKPMATVTVGRGHAFAIKDTRVMIAATAPIPFTKIIRREGVCQEVSTSRCKRSLSLPSFPQNSALEIAMVLASVIPKLEYVHVTSTASDLTAPSVSKTRQTSQFSTAQTKLAEFCQRYDSLCAECDLDKCHRCQEGYFVSPNSTCGKVRVVC